MKTIFLCPFNLGRLTGTPIRTIGTVKAAASFSSVWVLAAKGAIPGTEVIVPKSHDIWSFTKTALALLRKTEPDTVHGVTTVAVLPMIIYKCIRPSARLIFEMHGWAWYEQSKRGLSLTRVLLFVSDFIGLWLSHKVIVMSETQRHFLSRWTIRIERIHTIWGPCDFESRYVRAGVKNQLTVGYIGNSGWWQGLPIIIRAAEKLKEESGIAFRLAGFDASDDTQFPRLPNVTYVGRVERADVLGFLRSCDVLVSSRLKERVSTLQYPQKLSEYLGAGRPVIVSAVNDQGLIVDRARSGIVVDPMSAEKLALSIHSFTRLTPMEREEMGKRGLTFAANNFAPEVFRKKLQAVYFS